jgi:hypothetical protein
MQGGRFFSRFLLESPALSSCDLYLQSHLLDAVQPINDNKVKFHFREIYGHWIFKSKNREKESFTLYFILFPLAEKLGEREKLESQVD